MCGGNYKSVEEIVNMDKIVKCEETKLSVKKMLRYGKKMYV